MTLSWGGRGRGRGGEREDERKSGARLRRESGRDDDGRGCRRPRKPRGAAVVLLALGFAALLTQCHLVLDDVNPSRSRRDASGGSGGAGTETGGAAATTTCTKDGVHRCDGTSLEVCEAGTFKPVASCGSPEQCDAEHGVCLDCAPGAARCSSWRVETCTNSGGQQGWELEVECSTPELCDVASRGCLVCAKEAAFCNGSLLYLCTDDQRDWNVTDCKEVRLCNARAKECVPCTPGEYQCNGKSLQRCDDTQNWVVLDECVTNELCQATLTSRSNDPATFDDKCVPPGCTLGQFRCSPSDGAQIEGCPGSQLGWEPIAGEHCLTSALCNPITGHCDPGCVPGTYRCLAERLEVCKLDGTGFQLVKACTTAAYCNATKRDCVPCVEGEYQCSGATLQRCNSNQTWATKEVCQSEALCLAGGTACKAPVCKLGEFRCNNGKELQICAANRNGWETRDNCVTAALCDSLNGRCNSPECAVGESRCFQNAYQVCDSTTRKWGAAQKCASTELCTTVGTDHCIDGCPTPNLQCSGSVLQRCNLVANPDTGNNEAKWNETVAVCATAALCSVSSGGCLAPACEPKTYTCSANVLRTCNADQTGYEAVATCTSSQICDAAGHQCDTCAANSYSCDASTLRQCSTDGQSWKDAMACDSASLCYAAGAAGYCHFCNLGDAQCMSGVALSRCEASTSGQRVWGTSDACELNVCQDGAGNADYCVGCAVAGEIRVRPNLVTWIRAHLSHGSTAVVGRVGLHRGIRMRQCWHQGLLRRSMCAERSGVRGHDWGAYLFEHGERLERHRVRVCGRNRAQILHFGQARWARRVSRGDTALPRRRLCGLHGYGVGVHGRRHQPNLRERGLGTDGMCGAHLGMRAEHRTLCGMCRHGIDLRGQCSQILSGKPVEDGDLLRNDSRM
ncbi:MAG: hypothetical protein QM784_03535 [Polyangiaceae bacterium]